MADAKIAPRVYGVHVARAPAEARLHDPRSRNRRGVASERGGRSRELRFAHRLREHPFVDTRLDTRSRRQPDRGADLLQLRLMSGDRQHLLGDGAEHDVGAETLGRLAHVGQERFLGHARDHRVLVGELEAGSERVGVDCDHRLARGAQRADRRDSGRAARPVTRIAGRATGSSSMTGAAGRGRRRGGAVHPCRRAASSAGPKPSHGHARVVEASSRRPLAQVGDVRDHRRFPLPPRDGERDRGANIGVGFVAHVREQRLRGAVQIRAGRVARPRRCAPGVVARATPRPTRPCGSCGRAAATRTRRGSQPDRRGARRGGRRVQRTPAILNRRLLLGSSTNTNIVKPAEDREQADDRADPVVEDHHCVRARRCTDREREPDAQEVERAHDRGGAQRGEDAAHDRAVQQEHRRSS